MSAHNMPTFKDFAREALKANGYDAGQLLEDYVTKRRSADPLVIEHEGLTYEFKRVGISVNFELMARLQGQEKWLEVAFLSDH